MRPGPPEMSRTAQRFSFPVTRRRFGPEGTNADGYPVDASQPVRATILAHVYPKPGETVERLQGGRERTRVVEGCTCDDLRLAHQNESGRADQVLYDGDWFEVRSIADWPGGPAGKRTWRVFEAVRIQP